MKKTSLFMMLSLVALILMGSCGNKTEHIPFDNGDSAALANADPTVYGVSGMATTMNTLQLITDTGDTLMFDLADARDEGQVLGGIHTGDRMAVIPNADRTAAVKVINQTTLLGNWVMPNPLDGSDEVGIRIKEGGVAEGIERPALVYRSWRLTYGQLEIVQVDEDGSGEEETLLYDIVKLGADSLVFKDKDDTFEYSRLRAKKDPLSNIKLEEASEADYAY